jgi:tetratricopeptide (TPR) repeat protein
MRRAQRRYPGDYWINYRLGQKLVGKGAEHADEAIGYLRAAIAVRPSPEPYFQLGKGLAQRARWDEAVAAYRTAIELGGGTASTHTGLGYALEGQGKPAEAVACFRRAIELDSAAAGRHVNLGRALRKLAKLDEAVASYQKAIELDPKRGEYHSAIGLVRAQQGKLVEATALFRTAIALDPKDVAAHHNLGVALNNQGKVDEAIASYRAAIELDPKHSLAHHNLGACLQQQGKLDEAVASYRTAIALDPKGYLAYRSCGDALYMQGKLGEAIACYQRAVELKPDDLDRLNELAWLLATCPEPKYRNAARAVELGKKAVELSPESGSFWNTLGVAHYRAGDWTAAVSALHRSIELRKGGDSTDWFVLAMAHWRLGERDTARAWYDKATAWMAKNQPRNEELRRFRAEAEELMGLGGAAEVAPPPRQKK